MSVGNQPSKAQIDGTSGALVIELENVFSRIERFAQYLQATPDATLITMGYLQAEVNTLKSAYVTDILQLLTLYRGTATLGVARDFRTFTHLLWGAGL